MRAQNLPRLSSVHGVAADDLALAVDACRARGHAFFAEDAQRRMAGVGVALIDRRGRPQGAIAVTSLAERLDPARQQEVAALLTREARGIEDAMWRLPDQHRHRTRWSLRPVEDFGMRNQRRSD
jgi:DNA-binding IclR family transcriptional regulator